MDSYDNDGLLLFLDDDLFPAEDDEPCGSDSTTTPLD